MNPRRHQPHFRPSSTLTLGFQTRADKDSDQIPLEETIPSACIEIALITCNQRNAHLTVLSTKHSIKSPNHRDHPTVNCIKPVHDATTRKLNHSQFHCRPSGPCQSSAPKTAVVLFRHDSHESQGHPTPPSRAFTTSASGLRLKEKRPRRSLEGRESE